MSVIVRLDERGRFAIRRTARRLGFDLSTPVRTVALSDGSLRIVCDGQGHAIDSRMALVTDAREARIEMVDGDLVVTPVVQAGHERTSPERHG